MKQAQGPSHTVPSPHPVIRTCRLVALAGALTLPLAATAQTPLPDSPGFLLAAMAPMPPAGESSSSTLPELAQAMSGALQAPSAPIAQSGNAQIEGIVSDIQGGLVPGAKVELEAKASHNRLATTADQEGHFVFGTLPAGEYTVYIEAPGLAKFASSVITLKAEEHYELPGIALPVASDQTVDVFFTRREIAQQELHVEEQQRALGVFPNFYMSYIWDAAPLDAKQKFTLGAHAVFDPVAFGVTAAVAGVQQAHGTYKEYGHGWAGYGRRYGSDYGNQFIGYMVGRALLPAIFRQDPRYFYMGSGSVKKRTWHAVSSSFLCRGDKSTRYQVCYSHILGNLSAGAIANTYHPEQRGVGLTFGEAFLGIGGAAVGNVVREFVVKRISTHTPNKGIGKPEAEPDQHTVK